MNILIEEGDSLRRLPALRRDMWLRCPMENLNWHRPMTESSGRLLIYNGEDKEWQSIYDDGWGEEEATVACRQLGYSGGDAETGLAAPPTGFFSPNWGYDI